jgi:hypothetical protein
MRRNQQKFRNRITMRGRKMTMMRKIREKIKAIRTIIKKRT